MVLFALVVCLGDGTFSSLGPGAVAVGLRDGTFRDLGLGADAAYLVDGTQRGSTLLGQDTEGSRA